MENLARHAYHVHLRLAVGPAECAVHSALVKESRNHMMCQAVFLQVKKCDQEIIMNRSHELLGWCLYDMIPTFLVVMNIITRCGNINWTFLIHANQIIIVTYHWNHMVVHIVSNWIIHQVWNKNVTDKYISEIPFIHLFSHL